MYHIEAPHQPSRSFVLPRTCIHHEDLSNVTWSGPQCAAVPPPGLRCRLGFDALDWTDVSGMLRRLLPELSQQQIREVLANALATSPRGSTRLSAAQLQVRNSILEMLRASSMHPRNGANFDFDFMGGWRILLGLRFPFRSCRSGVRVEGWFPRALVWSVRCLRTAGDSWRQLASIVRHECLHPLEHQRIIFV